MQAAPFPSFSMAPQPGGQPLARAGTRGATWLDNLLYVAFLVYMLFGVAPLTDVSTSVSGAGSVAEPAVVLLLAGLAGMVLALRAPTSRNIVVDCWPVFLPLAWFCASVAWAQFPDLALRRAIVTVLIVMICLGIGVGIGTLRRAHSLLVAVLALVILADLATTVALPGFALSELGVRGFHSQKNIAGVVGMLAVVSAFGWTVGGKNPTRIVAGLTLAAVSGGFLLMTQSKTSILLSLIGVVALPPLMLLRNFQASARVVACVALLTLAIGIAAGSVVLDIDLLALVTPGNDATFTGRSDIWEFAQSEIARRPWIGYGYGSFWDVGDVNDPLLRAPAGSWLAQNINGFGSAMRINQAHNGYLDLQLQGGLPGLILALIFMIWSVGAMARKLLASREASEAAAAGTFLVIALLTFVHNMTESSIWMRGSILGNVIILIGVLALRRVPASGAAARARR